MIVCCEVISLVLCNIVGKFRYLPLLMRLPAELGSLFGPSFIKGWVLRLEVPVSVRNSGMRQLLLQRKVSRMPQGFVWQNWLNWLIGSHCASVVITKTYQTIMLRLCNDYFTCNCQY